MKLPALGGPQRQADGEGGAQEKRAHEDDRITEAALTLVLLALASLGAGTELQIRLKTPLSSRNSKSGDAVEAVVVAPVAAQGQIWMAPGEVMRGRVRAVQAAGPDEQRRAGLELEFGEWRGKKFRAKVAAVDNARETADEEGRIVGIMASSGRLAEFLQAAKAAVLKKPDVDISYEAGVELLLQLTQALAVDQPAEVKLPAITSEEELHALVDAQPFQTMAEKPSKPSDLTNLMFLGSREQVFQGKAVWVSAATHDIGIEFSQENRTFIHKIDGRIDRERAKVVNDFLLTGLVKGLALVERPAVPKQARNATGDDIETDGAMAVLLLN
jgi:hypothetical protein